MNMSGGLLGIGAFLAVFVLLVPVLGVIGLLVVLAIRRDGDEDGSRAPALYAALVAFFACFTLLIGATVGVSALANLQKDDRGTASFFDDSSFTDGGSQSSNDREISTAIAAGLVCVAAAAVLVLHRSLIRWAADLDRLRAGGRIFRAYALITCLVAVVLLVVALTSSLYDVFRSLAPGVTGSAERGDGLRELAGSVTLGIGAFIIYRWHAAAAGLPALAPVEHEAPAPLA
ncbi:MAG: hypothetical protein JF603_05890 [Acidobacteria bacterium]|nr:hypothetical protein [Acidobacteriota bacterium]